MEEEEQSRHQDTHTANVHAHVADLVNEQRGNN